MAASLILLGVVGRPHGVRGLVRVHSHTVDPAALASYGPLTDERGRRWTVRWRGDGIAELRDEQGQPLPDRTAAEKLVNTRLYADRAQLPPPADDEFYVADLVGLEAVDDDGRSIGRVATVHDYGAGASLEIAREGTPPLIVPFTKAVVPAVNMAAGCLTVLPPPEVDVSPLPLREGGEGAAP
jgi:16S rRNA processing protein RimM